MNLAAALTDNLAEILHAPLPVRRLRSAALVVKRKMPSYGVKRALRKLVGRGSGPVSC